MGFALEEVSGAGLEAAAEDLSPVRSAEIRSGLALLATLALCGSAWAAPAKHAAPAVAGVSTAPLLGPG